MKSVLMTAILSVLASSIWTAPSFAQAPAASAPASEFRACGKDWNEWKNDLKRVESDLEKWADQNAELLKSEEADEHREGRMIRLFAAHLLPKGSPFASMYKVCWMQYAEFEKAVGEKNKSEADESLQLWEACVRGNDPQMPKEAEDLLACWKKSSL